MTDKKQPQYEFNNTELGAVIIQVLTQVLAYQQVSFNALLDATDKSDYEKDEIRKEVEKRLPSAKDDLLSMLFADFGATPSI